ncbi:MAG: sigma-70 family RNA polymerase sigma factor [Firmicutes bacterium]|nr:sigma-70 family RNA polymerase sigma factor [Bacillota bacterium]
MEKSLLQTKEFKHFMVEKYFNMIYKLALSQTGEKEHAEDVTSDVFLKFISTDKKFETEEHIKAWLIRVTINCSKGIFSNSWFKKTVPLEDNITVDMPDNESEVYEAVLSLPHKYRAVIHLFYYEELSVAQIAKYMKINESTVRSQLHRGREMLKIKLKGEDEYV